MLDSNTEQAHLGPHDRAVKNTDSPNTSEVGALRRVFLCANITKVLLDAFFSSSFLSGLVPDNAFAPVSALETQQAEYVDNISSATTNTR